MKKISVVKLGGTLLEERSLPGLLRTLKRYARRHPLLLVHGGGREVSAFSQRLGIQSRFVRGRRFTDAKTMEAAALVLSGMINPALVGRLRALGVEAVGMNGRLAGCVRARPVPGLGLVGEPVKVRSGFILSLLRAGLLPVFSSIAEGMKGGSLNVNADDMAAALARDLKAERLIFFTDVAGVLDGKKKTIPRLTPALARRLAAAGVITGGMIPKCESAFSALKKGVREVWILEGRLPLSKSRGTLFALRPGSRPHPFR